MGYDVELRHNGPDGLAAALASPYHAVILDGHSEAKSRGIYIPVSEIQEIHFICSHHYEIILQKIA
jgi:hypothetical protein